MICVGCQPPHQAADCVDVIAGRDRADRRHCHCQHYPRPVALEPGPQKQPETAEGSEPCELSIPAESPGVLAKLDGDSRGQLTASGPGQP